MGEGIIWGRNKKLIKGAFSIKLGEKIVQLRKSRGLSQEQLASQLSVSRQAVSRWELGDAIPDTENVLQISRLFSVSVDFLLNEAYNDDEDIPAVQAARVDMQAQQRRKQRIIGYSLLCVGVFGILLFGILASVIPASRVVRRMMYPEQMIMEIQIGPDGNAVPETERIMQQEPMLMHTSVWARGSLRAFLRTFHLTWLFTICVLLTLIGLVLVANTREKIQRF